MKSEAVFREFQRLLEPGTIVGLDGVQSTMGDSHGSACCCAIG